MKRQVRGVGVGTVSLVMIFAVLCLTVFALLTLSTANSEKIMAEKAADFVQNYYTADMQATDIMVQVIASNDFGNIPKTVQDIEITATQEADGTHISYTCPIDEMQNLYVEFVLDQSSAEFRSGKIKNEILVWEARDAAVWEFDDSLNVWDGTL